MAYLRNGLRCHGAIADLCSSAPCPSAASCRESTRRRGQRRDHPGAPTPQQGAMAPWLIWVTVCVVTAPSLTHHARHELGVAADWQPLPSRGLFESADFGQLELQNGEDLRALQSCT